MASNSGIMAIWGKLYRPRKEADDPDESYFYSTALGPVDTAEGSGYVIPTIDEGSVEKTEFVPLTLAQQKLQDLGKESLKNKEAYDKYVSELKDYYESSLSERKKQYETIIKEIKNKAMRHVEIQKIMKQKSEDKLSKELRQSEDELEELRDSMAALNRDYQEEVRALKTTVADTTKRLEETLSKLHQIEDNSDCKMVMDDLIAAVIESVMGEDYAAEHQRAVAEQEQLHADIVARIGQEQQHIQSLTQEQQTSEAVRKECFAALNSALAMIEINDMKEQHQRLELLRKELDRQQANAARMNAETEKQFQILQQSLALSRGASALPATDDATDDVAADDDNGDDEDGAAGRRQKISVLISQVSANQRMAEVQVCMNALIAQILERHTDEVVGSSQQLSANTNTTHSEELNSVVAQYEKQIKELNEDFEEKSLKLKSKFNTVLKDLKTKSHRDEVALVLGDIVCSVVERNPPLASVLGWKTPVAVPTTPAKVTAAAADGKLTATEEQLQESLQQQQVLAVRVQELEGQLHEALTAAAQPARWATPSSNAPIETTTTAADTTADTPVAPAAVAPVAAVATAAGSTDDELGSLQAELAKLEQRAAELKNTLIPQSKTSTEQLTEALSRLNDEKEKCKNDIKEWTRIFQEENGREPDVKDKATVKDKYQRYKAISTKTKEVETQGTNAAKAMEEQEAELVLVQQQIAELKEKIAAATAAAATSAAAAPTPTAAPNAAAATTPAEPSASRVVNEVIVPSADEVSAAVAAGAVMVPKMPTSDAEVQTEDTSRAAAAAAAASAAAAAAAQKGLEGDKLVIAQLEQAHATDTLAIEQLEDQLYQMRQEFEQTLLEKEKNDKERDFLAKKVDMLVTEKRTDVVKRLEDDVEAMRIAQATLNEQLATLKADKVKSDIHLKELKERAETSEAELKARDDREIKGMPEQQEKMALKTQIGKQREQIIMKQKAATAGWDAAANSDERLDIEVEKAYLKGLNEEKDRHKGDLDALNKAVEKKEARVTELTVQVADMEHRVQIADEKVKEMQAQMDSMQLEVADTIAGLVQMGGGGGGGEGGTLGPTEAEYEAAQEALNEAQSELVDYIDRCDKLETELEQARIKNRVLERLANMTGLTDINKTASKAVAHGAGRGGGVGGCGVGDNVNHDLNDIINAVKKAIVKGTNLWKSNRKDECYDLYYETCAECHKRLLTEDMRNPINDAMTNGKLLGAQNKQRGAVVLRKALDKVLADADKGNLRQAENDANDAIKDRIAEEKETAATERTDEVKQLVEELAELEDSFLDQGFTKEQNPSNSNSSGGVKASPREGAVAEGAPSLLARAKKAEEHVERLKKQLATVMQAAANNNSNAVTGAPMQEGAVLVAGATDAGAGAGGVVAVAGDGSRRPSVLPPSLANRRTSVAGGGADPAEVRRLNRKIKELEAQLAGGGGGGGGGAVGDSGGSDSKAAAANDKALQKKIKEMETMFKRDKKNLEQRASKAENALNKINASHTGVVNERDKLRTEVKKFKDMSKEMQELRDKAARCTEVETALADKMSELDVLQDQFKKETALRKKYKNELEDLKGAIRVYARMRPMAKYELERGCKQAVEIKDETGLKVITGRGEKDFEFDAVFSDTSKQEAVFEDTKRLVESCMDGFNVCLFAYGQTGSGKTFTMTGSPDLPGLTPRAIDELFRLIKERKHLTCKVTTYFVELYNDNLVDLYWQLDNKTITNPDAMPKLDIKMDNKKMVYIRNSVIKDANSPTELMDLFNEGNMMRHTGATKMNAESSRSHSIFAIMVESYDNATKRTTTGKLSLVDLAGSERADKTGASADRLREAQSINKSLSALGDVIAALSEGTKFIPYRNNKLTQLMQDSLGGNAKTLMFVNFSPADYNSDETTTSLMYAARVKKIINNASKAAESAEVAKLKAMIKRLKAGQAVDEDIDADQPEEDGPAPPDDDGKVYDGY